MIVIDGTRFALFLSAALILALTPGPGMLYVLGRTLHAGRREGVLSSQGTLVGGSVHVVAAAFGLSAYWLSLPWPFPSSSIRVLRTLSIWGSSCCEAAT